MARPCERYTAEDLARLQGDFELDQGVLVPLTRPSEEHAFVVGEVFARLREHVRQGRTGRVYCDVGHVLSRDPDTVRGPDVSYVRAERLQGPPSRKFAEGAPDLAVEVVSATPLTEAIRKASEYLAAGTALVWVLDCPHRRALVFRADGVVTTLDQDDFLQGWDVLPGFRVLIAELLDGEP